MKYVKLFEDWNDLPSATKVFMYIPQQLRKNSERLLNKLFGADEKNLYANAEEMKEIEKVKQYYKWWYSNPTVISKISTPKGADKGVILKKILDYIDKKLVPSEFRIFRSEEDTKKYLSIVSPFGSGNGAWIWNHTDFIFVRLDVIKNEGTQLFGAVLHEVAHLIQIFASQELKAELYNPTMPKGAYGTDSIKYGLFLPPVSLISQIHNEKPYADQEIEQFARFHVMRFYFGIKPNDNCNVICDKIKKNITNGNYALRLMERGNGEKYLLYADVYDWQKRIPHVLNNNLFYYIESLGTKITRGTVEHFKNKGWSDMELKKLNKFQMLLDLNTICHDHQNIVSKFDIDEKNLA